jgi:uncharacterized OB-fold protein
MTSVVKLWRQRALMTTRRALACAGCGAIALVARRACARCGSQAPQVTAPLPRGTVIAKSAAGASVEHLDQVTPRRAAALVELDGGAGRVACLVAHADSLSAWSSLTGAGVRFGVRRQTLGELPSGEPIVYTFKATLDLRDKLARKTAAAPPEPKK